MMTTDASGGFPCLTPEEWQAFERRVAEFESAWGRGDRPDLGTFAQEHDPSGGWLLVELAHAELEFRLARGEATSAEVYLATYPQLAERPAAADSLRKAEKRFLARSRPQERPSHHRLGAAEPRYAAPAHQASGRPSPEHDPDGPGPREDLPRLPGYECLAEIGRGGMAVVYSAVDRRLNRTVAIKTVRADADEDERERLRREAEAVATLQHPNVVQIHQVLDHAGQLYVISEYMPGGTLAGKVAGAPIPAPEAAAIVELLARTVSWAHSRGIIHRDLKPTNVLLTDDGTPKISDFGLAKWIGGESELTRTGVVAGSPSYMAPEQIEDAQEAGVAADIWALGAILYELLTGRPPFRGSTVIETLDMVRTADPVPPRRLVPKLPRDLETICLACLRKEPERRHASAEALAEDLARFSRGDAVKARPIGRPELFWRWARRHPAVAALSAVLAVLLGATTTGSVWESARLQAYADAVASGERQARHLLFAADMRAASDAVGDEDPKRSAELLTPHERERTGDYAFVWNHLDRRTHAPAAVIDQFDGPARFACLSPDGGTIAACGDAGEIRFYHTSSGSRTERFVAGQGAINGIAYSPDGQRLASAGGNGVVVLWDLGTKSVIWRAKIFNGEARGVTFGLNGAVLAACGDDGIVQLIDPGDGTILSALEPDAGQVNAIAVTPDGSVLFAAGGNGRATAWNLSARSELWRVDYSGRTRRLTSIACSGDGRSVAFGTAKSEVLVADAATGRVLHSGPLPGPRPTRDGAGFRSVAFSAAGDALAIASDRGTIRMIAISGAGVSPFGWPRASWDSGDQRICSLAAVGDGTMVTTSLDGSVARWKPAARPPARLLQAGGHRLLDTAWVAAGRSPGRLVIASDQDLRIVDSDTAASEPLEEGGTWLAAAASSDGRMLVAANSDGLIKAWNVSTQEPTAVWQYRCDSPHDVNVASDGSCAVVDLPVTRRDAAPNTTRLITVLDARTGRNIADCKIQGEGCPPAVSPDGRTLAVSREDAVLLLDTRSAETVTELRGHSGFIETVAFSPDGRLVASGGRDRKVIVWDWGRGSKLRAWRADVGDIVGVRFSPNGRMLLTATADHPPRVWDVETGRLILEPGSVPRAMMRGSEWHPAFFASDGLRIVAGSGGATVVFDGRPLR